MKHSEKLVPGGAMAAALLSLACCVPLGITAGFGLAGIGLFASQYQPWLIAASVVMVVAGLIQLVRNPACRRRSRAGIVMLCVSAALVLAVTVFPQSIAGFLADRLPSSSTAPAAVAELDPGAFAELKKDFNRAVADVRVIVLLSPT